MDLKCTNGVFVQASNHPSLPIPALWKMVRILRPPLQIQVNPLEPLWVEKSVGERKKWYF